MADCSSKHHSGRSRCTITVGERTFCTRCIGTRTIGTCEAASHGAHSSCITVSTDSSCANAFAPDTRDVRYSPAGYSAIFVRMRADAVRIEESLHLCHDNKYRCDECIRRANNVADVEGKRCCGRSCAGRSYARFALKSGIYCAMCISERDTAMRVTQ